MATQQIGLLPCNHLLLGERPCFNVSTTYRLSSYPPKLNSHSLSTETESSSKQSVSPRRRPKSHLVLTPEIPKRNLGNIGLSRNNEVDDYPSLRTMFNVRGGSFYDCKQLHGYFVKLGTTRFDVSAWNKLVILYSKSEELLDDARQLFDEIPHRIVPAYAALIGSYCRSQRWEELFLVFRWMVGEGMLPDKYLLPTVLKACSAVQSLRSGKTVHGFVVREELGTDVFVGNALIDLYANCGELAFARNVFDTMQERDVVSWTALFSAYIDKGLLVEATDIFQSMQLSGVKPDLICWNALISGFARIGEIDLAFQFLEDMQEKGLKPMVTSWNGIISGCVQNGYFEEAINALITMLLFPENPNSVTVASILPACAGLNYLNLGQAIHGYALKSGLHQNIHVEGALVDMYSKCGKNDHAENVFVHVESKNAALWNEKIAAYVDKGEIDAALELLRSMQNDGVKPDVITYNTLLGGHARMGKKKEAYELLSEMTKIGLKPNIVSFNILISGFQQAGLTFEALKLFRLMQSPQGVHTIPNLCVRPNQVTTTCSLAACADLSALRAGEEIHGYVLRNGFECNVHVSSALIDMYAKCQDMKSAAKIFWKLEERNTVSWNSMIGAFIKNKHPKEALELFNVMLIEGQIPSWITFMILLPACGDTVAPRVVRALHGYILKIQDIKTNSSLARALVDMYAKCGSILDARLVFDSVSMKDIALCNAMDSANLAHGMTKNAVD